MEKIGLITVDEIVAAGSGKHEMVNYNYYLNKDNAYWAFTPIFMNTTYRAYLSYVNFSGNLTYLEVTTTINVAPVILLTSEYVNTLIGNGTINDYFREKGLEP